VPFDVTHIFELPAFIARMMRREFGVGVQQAWELGGAYFPTPGVTPEIVYPFAIEVEAEDVIGTSLQLASIDDVIAQSGLIQDAHSLIAIHRLAHALGRLD
jgi:hypothetical protein